jgi:hypothetical protein
MMKMFVAVGVFAFGLTSCGSNHSQSDLQGNKPRPISKPDFRVSGAQLTENSRYPIRPNLTITPGELCDRPSELRYPERVNYCERDVDQHTKIDIFVTYDNELGYHTREMDREAFKIDHLIPLCMGGSNKEDNLWPQHKTVYAFTDPVEPYLCGLMSMGEMKQAEAVKLILEIKQEPSSAPSRMKNLDI